MQKKNENKKNKKVVVVAAMALLLALVGISGGETYAKYASNQTDSATATVAKWGYTVSANANELFGQKYGVADANNLSPVGGTGVNVTGASNVVAPGTTGSMSLSVNGDAEVLSNIDTNFTIVDVVLKTKLNGVDQTPYYPLHWTVDVVAKKDTEQLDIDGGTDGIQTSKTFNGASAVNDINALIDDVDGFFEKVAVNTPVIYTLTLSWKWEFSVGTATDKLDTIFGGLAKEVEGGATTYTYKYGDSSLDEIHTNNGSIFDTSVDASVTVSQIQD